VEDFLEALRKEEMTNAGTEQEVKTGHYFVVAVQHGFGIVINQYSL
jgi:hypothetical protein